MRVVRAVGCFLGGLIALGSSPAYAGLGSGDTVGQVDIRANVEGELKDGFVDSNPCKSTVPFTEFVWEPTPSVKSGEVYYTYDATAEMTPESQSTNWFVSGSKFADFYGVIDVATFESITITERRYHVGCAEPGRLDVFDPATAAVTWVPVITAVSLVPDVLAELTRLVPAPETFFPVADPVRGWLYVRTPMEVRVANLEPISASVTAANAVSSATASATAVPVEVVFEPGEPGGAAVVCPVEAVLAGWDRNDPDGSGCVYTYGNSSAITPSRQFQTRTRLRWHVSGSGGLDMTIETIAYDAVGVAEVQAVVIAP